MSAPLQPSDDAGVEHSRPMLGIGFKIASVSVFVAMSTLLKAAEGIPAGQLVFFRSFFAIFSILFYLWLRGQLQGAFKTKEPASHVWRGLVGVCAMFCSFFALTKLPLPESVAINYASPLIAVMLSAIVLKEFVGAYRWSAVFIGLIGVLIIIWPRMSVFTSGAIGQDEAFGAVAALAGAALAAVAMVLVRRLVRKERTSTIVMYFTITSTVAGFLTLPFGWVMPNWQQLLMLIFAGLAGGIAQILLTESYRHAPMSTIAPFEYTSLVLSLIIGFIIFGDIPTVAMLCGSAIVMMAGIFVIIRERKLAIPPQKSNSVKTIS
ncbi:DMT family transporter [Brucellaceae bacterium C25G]